MTPYIRFRPVVSQCGTFGARLSTYIDYTLQALTTTVFSYVKNSQEVIRKLQQHRPFPKESKVLTLDAESMYTNIDPHEGIKTVKKYIQQYSNNLPNTNFIIQLLELLMNNNIFQFGNTRCETS